MSVASSFASKVVLNEFKRIQLGSAGLSVKVARGMRDLVDDVGYKYLVENAL